MRAGPEDGGSRNRVAGRLCGRLSHLPGLVSGTASGPERWGSAVTPTVIVVGSINVDLVTYVERLPGPGETVIGGRFSRVHGGKGGNQAVAASRLGARTYMVGVVGRDDLGEAARQELASENVDVAQVRSGNDPTGVAQILVDAGGENLIAVAGGANEELSAGMVRQSFEGIDAPDAVVCAVLEIPEEAVLEAAGQAHDRGWPFVLNPAPARPLSDELVGLCSVVTTNQHEVAGLGRRSRGNGRPRRASMHLLPWPQNPIHRTS